jgi:hypothetical protein
MQAALLSLGSWAVCIKSLARNWRRPQSCSVARVRVAIRHRSIIPARQTSSALLDAEKRNIHAGLSLSVVPGISQNESPVPSPSRGMLPDNPIRVRVPDNHGVRLAWRSIRGVHLWPLRRVTTGETNGRERVEGTSTRHVSGAPLRALASRKTRVGPIWGASQWRRERRKEGRLANDGKCTVHHASSAKLLQRPVAAALPTARGREGWGRPGGPWRKNNPKRRYIGHPVNASCKRDTWKRYPVKTRTPHYYSCSRHLWKKRGKTGSHVYIKKTPHK